jgi:hypothetical protein
MTRDKTKISTRKATLQKMGGIAKSSDGSRGGKLQKRSRHEDESRHSCAERNARTRISRRGKRAEFIRKKE